MHMNAVNIALDMRDGEGFACGGWTPCTPWPGPTACSSTARRTRLQCGHPPLASKTCPTDPPWCAKSARTIWFLLGYDVSRIEMSSSPSLHAPRTFDYSCPYPISAEPQTNWGRRRACWDEVLTVHGVTHDVGAVGGKGMAKEREPAAQLLAREAAATGATASSESRTPTLFATKSGATSYLAGRRRAALEPPAFARSTTVFY